MWRWLGILCFLGPLILLLCCGVGLSPNNQSNLPPGVAQPGGPVSITASSPASGALGTTLTIQGDGFSIDTQVKVGGVTCRNPTLVSSTTLTCLVGRHSAGQADIEILNASYAATLSAGFTYRSFLLIVEKDPAELVSIEIKADGTLGEGETAIRTASNPQAATLDPLGRFVAVIGVSTATIPLHTLTPETGALGAGSTSPVSTAHRHLIFDPTGSFIFGSGGSGAPVDVASYLLNRSTGTFSKVGGIGSTSSTLSIGVPPEGRHVYGAGIANGLLGASYDSAGALSEIAGSPFGGIDGDVVLVDPSGRFVFSFAGQPVTQAKSFVRDAATGALTAGEVELSPLDVDIRRSQVHPTLRMAYLARTTGTIRTYSWSATNGTLAFVNDVGAPVTTIASIAVDPAGKYLYIGDDTATQLVTMRISSDGTLDGSAFGQPRSLSSNPAVVLVY